MTTAAIRLARAVARLGRWRRVFAAWQLGSREEGDPECAAVSDHREQTLILRAEVSAIRAVLINAGIVTRERMDNAVAHEADWLCAQLEAAFPGFRATDEGLEITTAEAAKTMEGWRP